MLSWETQFFSRSLYVHIILPVALYWCETLSLTIMDERRLRMFENKVIRNILVLRGARCQKNGEDYITRSFIICTHRTLFGWSNQEKWYGWGIQRVKGRGEVHIGSWWVDLRERDHLEEPGVNGRIILKWIFKKWDEGHKLDWYGSV
jgi:hypothetical protein